MNNYDGIEDALQVETDIVPTDKAIEKSDVVEIPTATKDQLKKDYEYTRGHLYSLIEKGQEAVDGILELNKNLSNQEHSRLLDN